MDIPELGDLSLNVEASKVSSTFTKIIEALRNLTARQEGLSRELASVADRVAAGEETGKNLAATLGDGLRKIDQLRDHVTGIDSLRLEEQTKKIQSHEQQFQKTLALLEQCDLKLKEQDAKIAQVAIEARQSSTSTAETVAEFSSIKSSMEHYENKISRVVEASTESVQRCNQIEEAQKNLQDSVASKYDKLWHEVVTALERMSSTELQRFQEAVSQKSQQSEQRVQQLISYAISLATRAATDKREADVKKAVISRWKERAWIGARQRMACRSLSRFFRIHLRRHFMGFQQVLAWEINLERLRTEFRNSLPDVDAVVRGAVSSKIKMLEDWVNTKETVLQKIQGDVERLSTKTEEFQVKDEVRAELDREADREDRLQKAEELVSDVVEKMSQVARQEEMQSIMKDVLLIWTAVKHLDTAKADKRELDALANEATIRAQHGDLSDQIDDVKTTMRDVNTRSKTLNYMLGIMMRFMEDAVRKIASMDPSLMQSPRITSKVIRTGGGWLPQNAFSQSVSRPVSPSRRQIDSLRDRRRAEPLSRSSTLGPDADGARTGVNDSDSSVLADSNKGTMRGLGDLPAPKTSSENLDAITLTEPKSICPRDEEKLKHPCGWKKEGDVREKEGPSREQTERFDEDYMR
ncbi:UNVERIFIED_CONTAM: mediator complex subunit MED9 [Hammondia hammondi]|eukprot:XP_008888428.1 mediator complex subunit MED9 [Hammondia hammondi]